MDISVVVLADDQHCFQQEMHQRQGVPGALAVVGNLVVDEASALGLEGLFTVVSVAMVTVVVVVVAFVVAIAGATVPAAAPVAGSPATLPPSTGNSHVPSSSVGTAAPSGSIDMSASAIMTRFNFRPARETIAIRRLAASREVFPKGCGKYRTYRPHRKGQRFYLLF